MDKHVLRCKVVCCGVMPARQNGEKTAEQVSLYAVYGQEGRDNAVWSKETPSAQFQLYISNPDAWGLLQQGQEYYVDFTPASG